MVLLGLACVVTGLLIRSINHIDCLGCDHQQTSLGLESFEQSLVFHIGRFNRSFVSSLHSSSRGFVDHGDALMSSILLLCEESFDNDCVLPTVVPEVTRWGGFSSGTILVEGRSRYCFCVIPYWSLVLPLTLLSAVLLLWPQRKREKHPPTSTVIQSPGE